MVDDEAALGVEFMAPVMGYAAFVVRFDLLECALQLIQTSESGRLYRLIDRAQAPLLRTSDLLVVPHHQGYVVFVLAKGEVRE